jgi:hypothetical protein
VGNGLPSARLTVGWGDNDVAPADGEASERSVDVATPDASRRNGLLWKAKVTPAMIIATKSPAITCSSTDLEPIKFHSVLTGCG